MIFDTHAHLDTFLKNGTLPQVLKRAKDAGIGGIIACSTKPEEWDMYESISKDSRGFVNWQAGIHPSELSASDLDLMPKLENLFLGDSPNSPCAMGEIGLDFYRLPKDAIQAERVKIAQLELFRRQLEIAAKHRLKICVHARNAVGECTEEIIAAGVDLSNVVYHCYGGTVEELKKINSLGGRASFTGVITYKGAEDMREAMLAQGTSKLMFESDCPYLSPEPKRGERNEPAYVPFTVKFAAELFVLAPDKLAAITTHNAREFFGLTA